MRHAAIRPLLIGALSLAVASCTIASDIDVCERTPPAEVDVNHRTEAAQRVTGVQSLAAMPGGGAFAVFVSQRSVADPETEIRVARLGRDGRIERTCDGNDELPLSLPLDDAADTPAFAAPTAETEFGLLVYRHALVTPGGVAGYGLRAVPLTNSGCPDPLRLRPSVEIRALEAGAQPTFTSVLGIGGNRFVVVWTELENSAGGGSDVRATLWGRVVDVTRGRASGTEYLPTQPAPDGAAVILPLGGDGKGVAAIAAIGEGRIALAWVESAGFIVRVHVAVLDDRFAVLVPPREVARVESDRGLSATATPSIALAWDGAQLLVAFGLPDPVTGVSRARARFLNAALLPLRSELSPSVDFRLGDAITGAEGDLAVTATRGGGFVATWTERDEASADITQLRAIAFDANGDVRFSNSACDRARFSLVSSLGRPDRPAIAQLADDTIVTLFTSIGASTNDRSDTGIRAIALRPSDIFAIE